MKQIFLFLVLSFIWGATWGSIKVGVHVIPPLWFMGTRFFASGAILLLWYRITTGKPVFRFKQLCDLLPIACFGILINHGCVAWSMQFIPSGLSAMLNMATIPLSTLIISLVYRHTTLTTSKITALLLGVCGLIILFLPTFSLPNFQSNEAKGWMLTCLGGVGFSWASVQIKQLHRAYSTRYLAGMQTFLGGTLLCLVSLIYEPITLATLSKYTIPHIAAHWFFLVTIGSIIALSIYIHLVHHWGAARASNWAFVSPVIAVAIGAWFYHEHLSPSEMAGSIVLLTAAWLSVRSR